MVYYVSYLIRISPKVSQQLSATNAECCSVVLEVRGSICRTKLLICFTSIIIRKKIRKKKVIVHNHYFFTFFLPIISYQNKNKTAFLFIYRVDGLWYHPPITSRCRLFIGKSTTAALHGTSKRRDS